MVFHIHTHTTHIYTHTLHTYTHTTHIHTHSSIEFTIHNFRLKTAIVFEIWTVVSTNIR